MSWFTRNGYSLFYREQGQGPLLLIVPGNTASSASYEAELAWFSWQYRAVALDLYGTGQSTRLNRWPDRWWEACAHDAAALIEHLGENQALVMGSSGGGIVALLLAMLYPERVQAVIADSCVEIWPAHMIRKTVAHRASASPEMTVFWHHAHGDDWVDVIEADSSMLLRLAAQGDVAVFDGRLGEIQCPVLLAASLNDRALYNVEGQVYAMAKQLSRSTIFLTNEGNHPLMWSCASVFRRAADCFLSSICVNVNVNG
jgi:pimeloyl-ACP methyl ester carboxylesterase